MYDIKVAGASRSVGRSWSRAVIGLAATGVSLLASTRETDAAGAGGHASKTGRAVGAVAGHRYDAMSARSSCAWSRRRRAAAVQNFVEGGSQPAGVAVDAAHIYWTNVLNTSTGAGTIGRANLDGTGVNQNFIDAGPFPFGLAVDSGHLYWTHVNFSSDPNAFDDAIGRANLDGTGADQSFIFGAFSPEGVAVSPQAAVGHRPGRADDRRGEFRQRIRDGAVDRAG